MDQWLISKITKTAQKSRIISDFHFHSMPRELILFLFFFFEQQQCKFIVHKDKLFLLKSLVAFFYCKFYVATFFVVVLFVTAAQNNGAL